MSSEKNLEARAGLTISGKSEEVVSHFLETWEKRGMPNIVAVVKHATEGKIKQPITLHGIEKQPFLCTDSEGTEVKIRFCGNDYAAVEFKQETKKYKVYDTKHLELVSRMTKRSNKLCYDYDYANHSLIIARTTSRGEVPIITVRIYYSDDNQWTEQLQKIFSKLDECLYASYKSADDIYSILKEHGIFEENSRCTVFLNKANSSSECEIFGSNLVRYETRRGDLHKKVRSNGLWLYEGSDFSVEFWGKGVCKVELTTTINQDINVNNLIKRAKGECYKLWRSKVKKFKF